MGEKTIGPNRLGEALREPVERYTLRLRELGGDNVLGLAIYGAASTDSFDPARHYVQNVVVLGAIDLEHLRRLAAEGPSFGRFHIAAPLVMTPHYIKTSLDTFPLEMIEISQQHITVFGREYFGELPIQDSHARLQCERELKVILVAMHQGLLKAGDNERRLADFGSGLAEQLLRILRGVAWLNGRRQPLPMFDLVASAAKIVGRPLDGVYGALNHADTAGWAKFSNLYADVEALGKFVDAW